MIKNISIKVSGKVQGVFFRKSTLGIAQKLYLSGWVKNEQDGSVAIEVEGPENQLEEFVAWCHKGPPLGRVDRVESLVNETLKNYTEFQVLK